MEEEGAEKLRGEGGERQNEYSGGGRKEGRNERIWRQIGGKEQESEQARGYMGRKEEREKVGGKEREMEEACEELEGSMRDVVKCKGEKEGKKFSEFREKKEVRIMPGRRKKRRKEEEEEEEQEDKR